MYLLAQVNPKNGAWNMSQNKFREGVVINKWAVAVCNFSGGRQPSVDEIRLETNHDMYSESSYIVLAVGSPKVLIC